MKSTVILDSLLVLNWYIDASYNTYDDGRGHIGLHYKPR